MSARLVTDSQRVAATVREHGGAMAEADLLAALARRHGHLHAAAALRLAGIVGRVETVDVAGERVVRVTR
jgi:hypothetical protein